MLSSFQIKGILKINGMLKETDKQKQIDEFNRAIEKATNSESSIVPVDAKADYTPLSVNPTLVDSQTLDFLQSKILDYFGVSKAIFNNQYNETEFNAFYESAIEPIAIQLSEGFSNGLLTQNELERGEEILFFSERLQYASWSTKVSAIEKLMGLGLMTLNESRALLGLVIIFIIIYVKKIKESIGEITDKSISIDHQDQVFDVILENNKVIEKIEEINCRKINKKTYIEVCVKMKESITYKEQTLYLQHIREEINKIIPNSVVKLVIGQTK